MSTELLPLRADPRITSSHTVSFLYTLCAILILAFSFSSPLHATAGTDSIIYSRGTFFGNAANDGYFLHMAVDDQGYIYGTGFGRSIPTTNGVYQKTMAGSYDVMVFKMDPTMKNLIWCTYIGGSNYEGGGSIAVNSAGEVFVSGYTLSPNFPVTVASDASYLSNGTSSIFALKLSADGSTLLYSRILGRGPAITQQTQTASKGALLAINAAGEAFVFSNCSSTLEQVTANAYKSTLSGSDDFVLFKLGATGNLVYGTYYGGSGAESAYDICAVGNKVYCTGTTASPNLALRSGKTPDTQGDPCVFVADDAGSTVHPRKCFCYGSTGIDQGLATWYDTRANRVCLTGVMGATVSYTSALIPGTSSGGYISAIDTALNSLQFMTMVGTQCVPTSVTTRTATSTIYSAGYTRGLVPLSPNAFQSSLRGSLDGYMVAIDSEGVNLRYGSYIGGTGNDYSAAKVLIVERGCVFRIVFGITTHSVDFPSTANTYQPQKLNGVDDQPAIAMFSSKPTATLNITSFPCKTYAHLQATSSCPLASIRWQMGDGTFVNDSVSFDHNYPNFGTYTVLVRMITTDGDTIFVNQDVVIGNARPVDAGDDQVVCKGNSTAQLHASGAAQFRWRPGKGVSDSTISNPVVHPDVTTTYVVYGMDGNGCESKDSVTIVVQDLHIQAERDTTICFGHIAFLEARGADFYAWSPSSGLSQSNGSAVRASPATSTKYMVIGIRGACYDTSYVTVNVLPKPKIHIPTLSGVCPQTAVSLGFIVDAPTADSDIVSVHWTPAAAMSDPTSRTPVVIASKSSWYFVTAKTKDGCEVSDSVFVPITNKLNIAVSGDTTVCVGTAIQLHAFGATSFEWSPPDYLDNPQSASPVCTAAHSVSYRVIGHGGQCLDTQYVHITIVDPPQNVQAFGDTTVCANDRVHLWAESQSTGVNYHWYPEKEFENAAGASVFVKPTHTQTYRVIVTNSTGCSEEDSVLVRVDSTIALSVGPDAAGCIGESVDFAILSALDSNVQISWTPNDGVWDATSRRFHVVIAHDQQYHVHVQRGSCFNDATMTLHAKPNPSVSIRYDSSICVGGTVDLHATSSQVGMKYRWLRNGQLDTGLTNPLIGDPQTHELLTDWDGILESTLDSCVSIQHVHIKVLYPPVIRMSEDTTICVGQSAHIGFEADSVRSILWSPSNDLSSDADYNVTAHPTTSTTYTAQVVGVNGCVHSDTVRVFVQQRVPLWLRVESPLPQSTVIPGDSVTINISAWSDSLRSIDHLSFDMVCVDDILQPNAVPYDDISAKRYMHIALQHIMLSANPSVVMSVRAMALQTPRSDSPISIEHASTDASLCPVIQTDGSNISILSCYVKGRSVTYFAPLATLIFPHPATDYAGLHVSSSYRGSLQVSLLSVLGQTVRQWEFSHDSEQSEHVLNLAGLSDGQYTLRTDCPAGSSVSPLVKSH